jgi:hypothetical protein
VPPLQGLLLLGHALVGRRDLPIPAWLFAWGAALVLIVSFAVLSFSWREARLEGKPWRPAPSWLSRLAAGRITEVIAGALGVFLLGVVIWSGLVGTDAPDQNFSLTFVYVTFWLGGVVLSVLLGDVFRALNPWRAIARSTGWLVERIGGARPFEPLAYPERLGRWPAAAGVVAFVWLELVYGAGGITGAALTPHVVAVATLLYSLYTFAAMLLFGVERWCERGETFSVYLNMYSRLSPFERRGDVVGFRRFLSGTVGWAAVPGSLALVVAAIGTTAFDGAQEGALKSPIASTFGWLLDRGLSSEAALRLTESLFLGLTLAAVAAVFVLGVAGMHMVRGSPPQERLRRDFAHTLVPIALAYLVAHYFSFFVFQFQAQYKFQLSDPLGHGWNLFGTAGGSPIDYTVIGSNGVWYVQVAALVIGHVLGLTLGHDKALAVYGDHKRASRSQEWMLAVMVLFTTTGLYLLSQANQ